MGRLLSDDVIIVRQMRLNADGTRDNSFNVSNMRFFALNSAAIQSDGKIVV
jgi:hypothetical protein